MTKRDQKKLLRNFYNQMRDAMLARAEHWPHWDGHELRELAAWAFDSERTHLMRADAKRRHACMNDIAVQNLY
jgi:hypothetical protein